MVSRHWTALIEAGLRFKESKTYENGSIAEIWIYTHDDITFDYPINGQKNIPLIFVQISEWHNDMGIKWSNTVYVRILTEHLPNYAEKFLKNVKSYYPLKEAIPHEVTHGDKVSTEYKLRYSKKESVIYADFEIDEYNWYNFHFWLDIQ